MGESLLPPLILELRAKAGEVHAELKQVSTEVDEMAEKTEGGMSRSQKAMSTLAGAGKAVTFGIAGAGLAIGAFGIEASTTAQIADAKLATAIKNVGGNAEELDPKIQATDASMRNFGFTNADTNTALAQLTTALKDPEEAMKDMSLAADLARMKNIPLAQSAMLVAKASEGQTKPLRQLGIDLPVYSGGAQAVAMAQEGLAKAQQNVNLLLEKTPDAVNPASKAHQAYEKAIARVQYAQQKLSGVQHAGQSIMEALTQRLHGQADAYGHTLAGQIAVAKAQMDNMGEKVGAFLIPKLVLLMRGTMAVVGWFGKHSTVTKVLAGVIAAVLVPAIIAYGVQLAKSAIAAVKNYASMIKQGAEWVATNAAQLAESAAAFATWVGEHAAMAAGFIAENVAMAASATAAFIAENAASLGLVAAIGAIVTAVVWLVTHWSTAWNAIKAVAKAVWNDGLKPVFDAVKSTLLMVWNDVIEPVFDAIRDHWKVVFEILTGGFGVLLVHWHQVWGAVQDVYRSVIQPVFSAIGDLWHTLMSVAQAAWQFLWGHVVQPIGRGFTTLVRYVVDAKNALSNVFSSFWDGLKAAGATVFNWIADAWNSTIGSLSFHIPSWVPGVGGDGFSVPKMPTISGYATGGSVTDGLFVAGENGPEIGFKSGSNLSFLTAPRSSAMLAGAGTSGGGSSGGSADVAEIHLTVNLDGAVLATTVERHQLRTGARRGATYQPYKR